jgi:hypothetical protein
VGRLCAWSSTREDRTERIGSSHNTAGLLFVSCAFPLPFLIVLVFCLVSFRPYLCFLHLKSIMDTYYVCILLEGYRTVRRRILVALQKRENRPRAPILP